MKYMLNFWPVSAVVEWIAWRVRERSETTVATWTARTVNSDESETIRSVHIVVLFIDGNGRRYSRVETTYKPDADLHWGVRSVRSDWRHHADVPSDARRVDNRPKGKLVSFPGGKGAA